MAKAKVSHPQKSDQPLGTLIAAVLAHPDLPEGVYNSIGDAMAELQSQPGLSTRAESIQAVLDGAKGRTDEPKAEQASSQTATALDNERELSLTMDQFRQLQLHWYAIGELSEMIDPPDTEGGGLACLQVVEFHLAKLMGELQAQVDERRKRGAA
jgi:hypothetical protein